MAKVEYLGPARALSHTGPSGETYLFFANQPLEVKNKEDIKHYDSSGGFDVKKTKIEKVVEKTTRKKRGR